MQVHSLKMMYQGPILFFPKKKSDPHKCYKRCYLPNCEEVPKGFRHFLRVNSDKTIVYPVAYITLLTCSTALSNFVFMVWKDKVHSTTMYVKRVTQISSTHGAALDMPTRSSRSPWTVPKGFPLFCRLQRNKRFP